MHANVIYLRALLMMSEQQFNLFGQIQTSLTGDQPYNDTLLCLCQRAPRGNSSKQSHWQQSMPCMAQAAAGCRKYFSS